MIDAKVFLEQPMPERDNDEMHRDDYPYPEHYKKFTGSLYDSSESPKPDDVHQNQLNDCQIMSTLCSAAQFSSQQIKDAISSSGEGTYTVTLYQTDDDDRVTPVYVDVDLYLVVHATEDNAPLYATFGVDKNNKIIKYIDGITALWPAVIEKAAAKYCGGFGNLSNQDMDSANAYFLILGAEKKGNIKRYEFPKQTRSIERNLNRMLDKDKICPTIFDIEEGKIKDDFNEDLQMDLFSNHAYALVDIDNTGSEIELTIQNPHAHQIDSSLRSQPVTLNTMSQIFSGVTFDVRG